MIKRSRWPAFSLVELLVVVSILSLLAGLVLLTLGRTRYYAQSTACKNHLHEMGMALQMWVHDNRNLYPQGLWYEQIRPYYALEWTNLAYHCPGYHGQMTGFGGSLPHDPLGSYAYNFSGVRGYDPRRLQTNFVNPGLANLSQDRIAAPAEQFAIGESRHRGERGVDNASGVYAMFCGYLDGPPEYYGRPPLPRRHGTNDNQLSCDGHVEALAPRILFDPEKMAVRWNYDHQPHPEFWPPFE